MRKKLLLISLFASTSLMVACATPPRVAQDKSIEIDNQTLLFGGVYYVRENELVLTVNGDPLMKGRFPPFTPTQHLKAQYNGLQIAGECYFGSVLTRGNGSMSIIAGAIQSAKDKANDKCEIHVNGKMLETLYF